MTDQRLELFERVLQTCERNYNEQAENFRSLDDKAQSNATIAGILIAACVAFVQEETVRRLAQVHGVAGPLLVAGTFILALLSILCSLGCMKVSRVEMPPDAEDVEKWVTDLANLDESERTPHSLENLIRDEAGVWKIAIRDHSKANGKRQNGFPSHNGLWSWRLLASALLSLFFCSAFKKHRRRRKWPRNVV